jgi:hypothetical protein
MGLHASALAKVIRWTLVPSFLLALCAGCDSGGPGVSAPRSNSESAVSEPAAERTVEERRKSPRGTNKAAAGAKPTGAE